MERLLAHSATEDVVYMLESLGIKTAVDPQKLLVATS
jgi:hypothetical protein